MAIDEQTLVRTLSCEHSKLQAYIWSLVHDVHMAEDVMQEVAMAAARARGEIESEQTLPAWLRSVARNQAITYLRKHRVSPILLDDEVLDMVQDAFSAFDTSTSADIMDALRVCIAGLSPYGRKIVELRYMRGLKGDRLAVELERKTDSVYRAMSRVHKALGECVRARLAKELGQHG